MATGSLAALARALASLAALAPPYKGCIGVIIAACAGRTTVLAVTTSCHFYINYEEKEKRGKEGKGKGGMPKQLQTLNEESPNLPLLPVKPFSLNKNALLLLQYR